MVASGQQVRLLGFGAVLTTPFVLCTLIEKYKFASKPIYAAFIDFRKAYDSLVRTILWQSLQSLSVLHGRMLDTIT